MKLRRKLTLAFFLTMAGEEQEAAPLAAEALALAQARGDAAREIDGLLQLGTTLQYCGERGRAVALFEDGLARVDATGLRAQEHFLLHHMGRCLAELGRYDEARAAFVKALVLRQAAGEPRFIASTQGALAELAGLTR